MPEFMSFKGKGLQAKKPSGPPKPKASLQKPVFGEDNGSDDDEPENLLTGPPAKSKSKPKPPGAHIAAAPKQHMSLSARHSFNKNANAAQELDPSVYEYDGVYDSLRANKKTASASAAGGANGEGEGEGGRGGPKYMGALLAAAEVRKRDQLRAKDSALARERAAEGDAFAGKDAFVTSAYKAQQADVRAAEEAERLREERDRARSARQGGAMTALYKDLLSRDSDRHDAAMRATEEASRRLKEKRERGEGGGGDDGKRDGDGANGEKGKEEEEEESEDEMAEERRLAKERGAALNEDGQVIDKRQLLTAGLNIVKKPKPPGSVDDGKKARDADGQKRDWSSTTSHHGKPAPSSKEAARERQSRMLEQQLEEATKRAADDDEIEKESLERANKRRTTEKDVSSARERYLARKREAEAARKASAG